MSTFDDNNLESALKCDFPARESFREALLANLLALNEQGLNQASLDEHGEERERTARIVKLEDARLEMLAAAQGEEHFPKNPLEEDL